MSGIRRFTILSDEEIDLKVNKQILKIKEFKDNNNVTDDMQLYVYNLSKKEYKFSTTVNNIPFNYNDDCVYNTYMIHKSTYIPIDDADA